MFCLWGDIGYTLKQPQQIQGGDILFELKSEDFNKIAHLIKSQNELSVFSVISGVMHGEIYVNSIDNPTAALIKKPLIL